MNMKISDMTKIRKFFANFEKKPNLFKKLRDN